MFDQNQRQQELLLSAAAADQESSMSNLTSSASASASASAPNAASSNKRKRSLPGNPDPEAEVVALSPRTLMATNRFVCEICGKGFQRDQNLQLHRRGHNLPWKLKQRGSGGKDGQPVRKKVYVCPEESCVHHDPARALGDLTGIKKHFFRKHGEKKWKCDKCSKKYAVHSDWKAHSKICGTREYRCDCGTIFSRRDSFITHRAFCDALTEESAKAIGVPMAAAAASAAPPGEAHHPLLFSPPALQQQELAALQEHHQEVAQPHQQQQHCNYAMKAEMPPWPVSYDQHPMLQPMCNALPQAGSAASVAASAHLSATALLQKAAQMGATIGGGPGAHYIQMAGAHGSAGASTFGLGLSCMSNQQDGNALVPGTMGLGGAAGLMGLAGSGPHGRTTEDGGGGGGGDDLTRDFLGLRAFSHRDILGLAGFDSSCMNMTTSNAAAHLSCYDQPRQPQQQQHQRSKEPWHS